MIFKAGEGAGRSGSFFFFSHDQKFVIKTMTTEELQLMKKIMPKYKAHLKKNPNSLLSKILGLFTVEATNFSTVNIMLMENTLRLKDPKRLKYVFDLKGSTVNRVVKGKTKNSTTLKDINFLLTKKKFSVLTRLSESTNRKLVNAMRSDVNFLSSLNLMDYSMLIAIERTRQNVSRLHIDSNALADFQMSQGFVYSSQKSSFYARASAASQISSLTENQKKNIGEWMSEGHRF